MPGGQGQQGSLGCQGVGKTSLSLLLMDTLFPSVSDNILVVSAGTDGRIAVWNCNGLLGSAECVDLGEPVIAERLHQSGVNGLDVRIGGSANFVVCGVWILEIDTTVLHSWRSDLAYSVRRG